MVNLVLYVMIVGLREEDMGGLVKGVGGEVSIGTKN